jgi:hypothetical protein
VLDRSVASRRVPVEAIAISNAHAITLLISQSSSHHRPWPEIAKGLAEYVVERVDQLASDMNESQEPQYFRGRDAEDYVLARW